MKIVFIFLFFLTVVSCNTKKTSTISPKSSPNVATNDPLAEAEARAEEAEKRAAEAEAQNSEEAERLRQEAEALQAELDALKGGGDSDGTDASGGDSGRH